MLFQKAFLYPQEWAVSSKPLVQWVCVHRCCCLRGGWLARGLLLASSHVPGLVGKNFLAGTRIKDQIMSKRKSRF